MLIQQAFDLWNNAAIPRKICFEYFWFTIICCGQVDDVVDASAVHGLCGLWGMMATGLFTTKTAYARAYSEVCRVTPYMYIMSTWYVVFRRPLYSYSLCDSNNITK